MAASPQDGASMQHWKSDAKVTYDSTKEGPFVAPGKLDTAAALAALQNGLPPGSQTWYSFYSTILGGIVTDPALMIVPFDDHIVHRGHAVFDTADVTAGMCYGLDFHLDRLTASGTAARIEVPPKEWLKQTILHTIAATGRKDGISVRYWLSCGRGDFYVSPKNCIKGSNFFCLVTAGKPKEMLVRIAVNGLKEVFVPYSVVPQKPKFLANAKTTNYMLNALLCMESETSGGYQGIGVDENGFITEEAIACIGFLSKDGVLRCPPFQNILQGTTMRRVIEMLQPVEGLFTKVDTSEPLTVAMACDSVEIISFGGGGVQPITSLNTSRVDGRETDIIIGTGKPGEFWKHCKALIAKDRVNPQWLDAIPYEKYA